MRVLHVSDTYAPTLGGIEVFVSDLARRQARAGHDVTVLTRTPSPGPDDTGTAPAVCRDPARLPELVSAADVVHAHASLLSPTAFRAVEQAARRGIPAVLTVHSMWNDARLPLRALSAVRHWAGLPVVWAAVSTPAARMVQSVLGRPDVMVLPNAVDAEAWAPAPAGTREPHGVVRIVAVGRMVRRKRPTALAEVLARARRLTPHPIALEAVLVGDGPLLPSLRREVSAASLGDWVHLPGRLTRPQIADLYRTSSIFLAPATRESFGIAALEARSAGLAVLARHDTGVGDFVTPGVDGDLATSDRQMAGQLARLCTDPELRRGILTNNVRARPGLDWSDVLWRNEFAYRCATDVAMAGRWHAGRVHLVAPGVGLVPTGPAALAPSTADVSYPP